MKRLSFIILAIIALVFASCGNNVEKARIAYDNGIDLMFNKSNFAEAEEQFTLAIKYDKNNYEAYYYRGCSKFNRALYQKSIEDFEKALEIKPNYSDAEFALGRTYFQLNDHDMSCFYYKAAARDGRENMRDYLRACPD